LLNLYTILWLLTSIQIYIEFNCVGESPMFFVTLINSGNK
jgi:hypothetical protein